MEKILFHPRVQKITSWVLFWGAIIAWPISALTFARNEPQFILGLSWVALILTGYNNLLTIAAAKQHNAP